MTNHLPILLSCLLLFVSLSSAQDREQSGVIKTADGVLVVSNEPGNYYTIEIKGKDIRPIPERPFWFQVDGKFFQIVTAEKKTILAELGRKATDDRGMLAAHRDWESDYLSKTMNTKLKIDSSWQTLANGMEALAWSYEMPHFDDRQTAKKQLYLFVSKKGDYVLGLNSVVEKDNEEKAIQQLLTDTMNTLKPSDKPLSLKKASEQVKKQN